MIRCKRDETEGREKGNRKRNLRKERKENNRSRKRGDTERGRWKRKERKKRSSMQRKINNIYSYIYLQVWNTFCKSPVTPARTIAGITTKTAL